MATAVKFVTLDDDNSTPLATISFEEREVTDIEIIAPRQTNIQKDQSGQPNMFILESEDWYRVSIKILNQGIATEIKLASLRNHLISGRIMIAYPKEYEDPDSSAYEYFGFIDPQTIPIFFAFSGRSKAGDIINLIFQQSYKP